MDLRVIGGGAAALAFGAGGLNYVAVEDVLSTDVRHVDTVPAAELAGYMESVRTEMSDAFDYMAMELEDYVFVADIEFTADARTRTFGEDIRSEDALDSADRKRIAADFKAWGYCESEDTQLFTSKGYDYKVEVRDGAGVMIVSELCKGAMSGLRS